MGRARDRAASRAGGRAIKNRTVLDIRSPEIAVEEAQLVDAVEDERVPSGREAWIKEFWSELVSTIKLEDADQLPACCYRASAAPRLSTALAAELRLEDLGGEERSLIVMGSRLPDSSIYSRDR